MPKTYLLIWLTWSGKSTVIYDQSGEQKLITDNPFYTCDGASETTQSFAHAGNDQLILLDTVGKKSL